MVTCVVFHLYQDIDNICPLFTGQIYSVYLWRMYCDDEGVQVLVKAIYDGEKVPDFENVEVVQ